jgi:hypothetical protein
LAQNFGGGDLNGRAAWSPDGASLVYNHWELFAPINLFQIDVGSAVSAR